MSVKIAVAGKGGTGKSIIAACLARRFSEGGGQAYAVDADPCGGLGAALGFSGAEISGIKPITDISEFIDTGDDDALYLSAPDAGSFDGQYSLFAGNVHFLKMARVKPADSGCYCREHRFLQALIKSMLLEENDALILDMGAGVEPLIRGTVKNVDILLIVSEAGRASIEVSRAIRALGAGLGIGRVYIVANKIRNEKEELLIRAGFQRGELIGLVRMSKALADPLYGIGSQREQKPFIMPAGIEELYLNLTGLTFTGDQNR